MKRFSLLVATLLFATALSATAQLQTIDAKKLPNATHEFIHKYFAQTQINHVEQDKGAHGEHYIVYFANGDKATFDGSSGRCTGMDLATGSVPDALIPDKVRSYISSHYPSSHVISIATIANGSRLMLSNGTALCFDREGNVMRGDCQTTKCAKNEKCDACAAGKSCSKHVTTDKSAKQ